MLRWATAGAIVAAGLLAWRLTSDNAPYGNRQSARMSEAADRTAVGEPPASQDPIEDPDGCLTVEQAELLPWIGAEGQTFDTVAGSGELYASYRGLDRQALEALVAQRDSAAMVVLGMQALVQAVGASSVDPIGFLEDDATHVGTLRNQLLRGGGNPDVDKLDEAALWFRRATLHGRVYTLQHVGLVHNARQEFAVSLGWASQAEFDAMDSRERGALLPENVYARVAHLLRPDAAELFDGLFASLLPTSDRQLDIATGIASDIERERIEAGLPDYDSLQTSFPSVPEIVSLLCPPSLPDVE